VLQDYFPLTLGNVLRFLLLLVVKVHRHGEELGRIKLLEFMEDEVPAGSEGAANLVLRLTRLRGLFILRKLREHDPARLQDVLADLYRDDVPDPQDIGKFEWQTILAYMGASEDEIADVQTRMGRRK